MRMIIRRRRDACVRPSSLSFSLFRKIIIFSPFLSVRRGWLCLFTVLQLFACYTLLHLLVNPLLAFPFPGPLLLFLHFLTPVFPCTIMLCICFAPFLPITSLSSRVSLSLDLLFILFSSRLALSPPLLCMPSVPSCSSRSSPLRLHGLLFVILITLSLRSPAVLMLSSCAGLLMAILLFPLAS